MPNDNEMSTNADAPKNYTGTFGDGFTKDPAPAKKQRPSIGRVVHFHHGYGNDQVAHLSARIAHVFEDGRVNLVVDNDGMHCNWDDATRLVRNVTEGTHYGAIGTWSWPPFVPAK